MTHCFAGLCVPSPGQLWEALEVVGITLQSCSLLLLLCPPRAASGSNQWKLAHQNEGKAKTTDRAIEMTSSCSCSSPELGWGKLPCLNMCVGRRADCLWFAFSCSCAAAFSWGFG